MSDVQKKRPRWRPKGEAARELWRLSHLRAVNPIFKGLLELKTTILVSGQRQRITFREAIRLRLTQGYANAEHPYFELALELGIVPPEEVVRYVLEFGPGDSKL